MLNNHGLCNGSRVRRPDVPNNRSRYSGNNEFIFTMDNGERIISGRSYKEQIAKALQEQQSV